MKGRTILSILYGLLIGVLFVCKEISLEIYCIIWAILINGIKFDE